jgi:hypothetical protein
LNRARFRSRTALATILFPSSFFLPPWLESSETTRRRADDVSGNKEPLLLVPFIFILASLSQQQALFNSLALPFVSFSIH